MGCKFSRTRSCYVLGGTFASISHRWPAGSSGKQQHSHQVVAEPASSQQPCLGTPVTVVLEWRRDVAERCEES
ncbi:hypothetical protein O3P69_012098 [Scylla paramamosain]|uniref:Uncharacterized protein n=1 Tax=Scylla paramamosain TaxID=85552 RepID=A0AAW0TCL0_SCYPA